MNVSYNGTIKQRKPGKVTIVKSKLFKIVIAAEFSNTIDSDHVLEAVMKALQVPIIPAGNAKVIVTPIDPLSLKPYVLTAPSLDRTLN